MNQRQGAQATILSAKAATGFGTPLDVSKYRFIGIAIAGATLPNLTVKCQGSFLMKVDPNLDFTTAQSVSNLWDYIAVDDLQDGMTRIEGDTGIAFAGTADVRMFKVNVDQLRTINFHVTAYVAGAVTVIAFPIQ